MFYIHQEIDNKNYFIVYISNRKVLFRLRLSCFMSYPVKLGNIGNLKQWEGGGDWCNLNLQLVCGWFTKIPEVILRYLMLTKDPHSSMYIVVKVV